MDGSRRRLQQPGQRHFRPIIFLDIDGVLNTSRQSPQIHLEHHLVSRLKYIAESTDALFVLTSFWRHFYEYITYVLHRHGIDVARHILPWPMGVTGGKQCTKTFLHFYRAYDAKNPEHKEAKMIEESTVEDEVEYPSRAEEIEAWLKKYGRTYLGGGGGGGSSSSNSGIECESEDATNDEDNRGATYQGYEYHSRHWRYAILDDRLSAAKPNTPLFERFVFINTKTGLTDMDAERTIRLLQFGDTDTLS